MIDELEWMSLRSKSAAYEKIEDITRNIAYPDFIVDDTLLSKYYAALDISSTDSYTTMLEKIFRFNQRTEFAKLIQGAAERNDFLGPPCTVNAWYEVKVLFEFAHFKTIVLGAASVGRRRRNLFFRGKTSR